MMSRGLFPWTKQSPAILFFVTFSSLLSFLVGMSSLSFIVSKLLQKDGEKPIPISGQIGYVHTRQKVSNANGETMRDKKQSYRKEHYELQTR